jgi:hypothetical protein
MEQGKSQRVGARPSDQALAVPATPASAVDGPAGFDPSRIAELESTLVIIRGSLPHMLPAGVANALLERINRVLVGKAR